MKTEGRLLRPFPANIKQHYALHLQASLDLETEVACSCREVVDVQEVVEQLFDSGTFAIPSVAAQGTGCRYMIR